MVAAWKGGRQVSAASERDRSRSRSATRGAWGGEYSRSVSGSVPHSVASSEDRSIRASVRQVLPWSNKDAALETRFATMTQRKESGPADMFVELFRDRFKSRASDDKALYEQDIVTLVWKELPFDEFATKRVAFWANQQFDALADDIHAEAERSEFDLGRFHFRDTDAKAEAAANRKAWAAAKRAVAASMDHMGKATGQFNTAKLAMIGLRDEEFFKRLDGNRFLVSFKNGCVDLRDGTVHARTLADPVSYMLDFDYDPAVSTDEIRRFIRQLFEDPESETLFQVHAGYMLSGSTTHKGFYQFAAEKDHGKSIVLNVIANAMGPLASIGKIPVSEFGKSTEFETTIGTVMAKYPPVRLIACDECNEKTTLNEQFLNQITSGLPDITVPCRMKQKGAFACPWHAKVVFATNHELSVSSASTGTIGRLNGPEFPFKFVEEKDWNPSTALPHMRLADAALTDYLLSAAARPEIAVWMVQGAVQFFTSGFPYSSAWAGQAFELRIRGDMYAKWITTYYTPTGVQSDRVSMADMRADFADAHKHIRGNVEAGLQFALATMSSYILKTEWPVAAPVYNQGSFVLAQAAPAAVPVPGFAGLRQRRFGDVPWKIAMIDAIKLTNEQRAACNLVHVVD